MTTPSAYDLWREAGGGTPNYSVETYQRLLRERGLVAPAGTPGYVKPECTIRTAQDRRGAALTPEWDPEDAPDALRASECPCCCSQDRQIRAAVFFADFTCNRRHRPDGLLAEAFQNLVSA